MPGAHTRSSPQKTRGRRSRLQGGTRVSCSRFFNVRRGRLQSGCRRSPPPRRDDDRPSARLAVTPSPAPFHDESTAELRQGILLSPRQLRASGAVAGSALRNGDGPRTAHLGTADFDRHLPSTGSQRLSALRRGFGARLDTPVGRKWRQLSLPPRDSAAGADLERVPIRPSAAAISEPLSASANAVRRGPWCAIPGNAVHERSTRAAENCAAAVIACFVLIHRVALLAYREGARGTPKRTRFRIWESGSGIRKAGFGIWFRIPDSCGLPCASPPDLTPDSCSTTGIAALLHPARA